MAQSFKKSDFIPSPDFDFSAEIPEFREQLYQKLLQRTGQHDIIPLSDEDLFGLNAAQMLHPTKPRQF